MPIYEYQCQKCQHKFEEIQKVSDPHVATCPQCGGTVERLISQTSFALKGGGWYKDGYATPSGANGKKEAAPGGTEGKKPGGTPTPTPPATTAKKD